MTDKIAVVTGATGGIGREIVRDLARDHLVFALGRSESKLAELGSIDGVTPVQVDLGCLLDDDPDLALLTELENIDLLVHCAAVLGEGTLEETSAGDWLDILSINTVQPVLLTRLLLPGLRRAEGQVVFLNSEASTEPNPGRVTHAASKAALRAVADSFREEAYADNVRVASIFPGNTATEMLANTMDPAEYDPTQYASPSEVARAVRLIADTGATTQFTNLDVRPRRP